MLLGLFAGFVGALVLLQMIKTKDEAKTKATEAIELIHAELWAHPEKGHFFVITSEKRAALRGDLSVSARSGPNDLRLIFGVYTHQEPAKMLAMMAPILTELERSLTRGLSRPVRIDLRIYLRYDDAQNALVRGDLHFMRVGSSSYVEARARDPGVSLLTAQNGRVRGYIFANADTGIRSLADLNGKSIALVDPSSTTGNYLAKLYLLRAGLTAQDLLRGSTNYLGSHDAVVEAVAGGQFDAGAANASVVDKLRKEHGNKLQVLHEFRESMGLPWVARPALDPSVAASIRAGLLAIKDKGVLGALGNETTAFIEAHDGDFESLRLAMREARNFDGILPSRTGAQ